MKAMNWQCFGLSSIVLMMAVVMIFTNKFLKKLLNFYFFWLGFSLLIISWFITFRFGYSWKTYHQYLHNKTIIKDPINDYEQSIIISKALLLDISPAVGILLPLSLIFDPSRTFARFICPLALISGITTIFIQMPFDSNFINELDFQWTAKWIFIGGEGNETYFLLHAVNFLLPISVYLNTPKGKISFFVLWSIIFTLAFYFYVFICITITGCRWNISGLGKNDWCDKRGEYNAVVSISKLSIAICIPTIYILLFIFIFLFCYIKYALTNKFCWKYCGEFNKWYAWYKV